jgi:hypothetical protein
MTDLQVRAALRPLFRRWGLPLIIRVDNGAPFGGVGSPLNLTSLSVWWRRLGILVEFIRPAKPQDNGAHEQMHRVLKTETLSPPARNLRAQLRRFRQWQNTYNEIRPHEALGGSCPARLYRSSPRPWRPPQPLRYPASWLTRRVFSQGAIRFLGRTRNIGRAFAGQTIGLKPTAPEQHDVFLGAIHLGTLHLHDTGGVRPCIYHTPPRRPPRPATVCKPSPGDQCK